MIRPGTKFKVPTREQFLSKGWFDSGQDHSLVHNTICLNNCITELMLLHEGEVLTVIRETSLEGWYRVKESYNFSWPVQACLDICGHVGEAWKEKADCECLAGQTPIMGFIICKHCGKDLEKVGM